MLFRGDGVSYPLPLDRVTIQLQAKVYHNGTRVHRERKRKMNFIVGMSGKCLHVQILGARNLGIADVSYTSDPYVIYSYCGKPLGTTRVRPRTLNPRWDNETFIVPLDESLPPPRDMVHSQKDLIKFEVFDHDWITQNDFLGHVEMTRSKLAKLAVVAQEQPIRIPLTSKEFHGILSLQLGLTSKHLHIKLLCAEDLDKSPESIFNDPYCRLFLGEKLALGQTPVVRRSLSPIWTERAEFSVPLADFFAAEEFLEAQLRFYRASTGLAAGPKSPAALLNNNGRRGRRAGQAAAFHEARVMFEEFSEYPEYLAVLRVEVFNKRLLRRDNLLGKTLVHLEQLRMMLPGLDPLREAFRRDPSAFQVAGRSLLPMPLPDLAAARGRGLFSGLLDGLRRPLRGLARKKDEGAAGFDDQQPLQAVSHRPTIGPGGSSVGDTLRGRSGRSSDSRPLPVDPAEEELPEQNEAAEEQEEPEDKDEDQQQEEEDEEEPSDLEDYGEGREGQDGQQEAAGSRRSSRSSRQSPSRQPSQRSQVSQSSQSRASEDSKQSAQSSVSVSASGGGLLTRMKSLVGRSSRGMAAQEESEEVEVVQYSEVFRLTILNQSRKLHLQDVLDEHQREDLGFLVVRLVISNRGSVVAGIDESVQRMTMGETSQVRCRFDYAYGAYTVHRNVPPRSNVQFTIKLLEINGHGRYNLFLALLRWLYRLGLAARKAVYRYLYTDYYQRRRERALEQPGRGRRRGGCWSALVDRLCCCLPGHSRGGYRRRDRGGADYTESQADSDDNSLNSHEDSDWDGQDEDQAADKDHQFRDEEEALLAEKERLLAEERAQQAKRPKVDKRVRKYLTPGVKAGGKLLWNTPKTQIFKEEKRPARAVSAKMRLLSVSEDAEAERKYEERDDEADGQDEEVESNLSDEA